MQAAHEELQAALQDDDATSAAAGSPRAEALPEAQKPSDDSSAANTSQVNFPAQTTAQFLSYNSSMLGVHVLHGLIVPWNAR